MLADFLHGVKKSEPFKNTGIPLAAAFAGTALGLGGLLLAGGALAFGGLTPALSCLLAAAVALGLAVEGAGLVGHARDLRNAQSEGAASFYA